MANTLAGKSIAVTGGGGGIGRAVALHAAAEGAKVVVADYGVGIAGEDPTSEVADAVVKEITDAGGEAVAVADSVTTMEGGERIVQTAIDSFGSIDGIVCIAGILKERMFFNMSEDEFDSVVDVHLKGTFTCFRAAAPHFKAQKSGSFISFTSGAFAGSVAQANYSSAKGGIVSLTRSVAAGMHRYGVTANVIAPVAKTRMSANVPFEIKNMGEPEDVAPMVSFLLSEHSRHVTGQIYTVSGGKIAVWDQPKEVRAMYSGERWTVETIADQLDDVVGQEEMGLIAQLEAYRAAAAAGDKPNA
jgi:NAD(P)-dependent dehydrogenase (short-subunit alcohol dehydrogenase family)